MLLQGGADCADVLTASAAAFAPRRKPLRVLRAHPPASSTPAWVQLLRRSRAAFCPADPAAPPAAAPLYPPQYYQGTPYQGYPGYYPPPPPPKKEGMPAWAWVGIGIALAVGFGKLLDMTKSKQQDMQQAMMQQMLKSMMVSIKCRPRPFPAAQSCSWGSARPQRAPSPACGSSARGPPAQAANRLDHSLSRRTRPHNRLPLPQQISEHRAFSPR
jgi:hypothetical protein